MKCFLPAQVLKTGGIQTLINKATVHNFSGKGLKLTLNFNLNPGSNLDLRLFLPEKKLSTSLSGEIIWSRGSGNKMEVGLKINNMDEKAKNEVINWFFPLWLKEEKKTKKK